MVLRFLTSNPNKLAEIARHVPSVEQLDLDLPEIQEIDPHEIVKAKLTAAHRATGDNVIVEDTSLFLDCLGGSLPGPFIKWFVGELGAAGIADLVLRFDVHTARAQTIIGYASGDELRFFEGEVRGRIVEPRGPAAFGWDPIFEPDGYDRTYAEMGEEKHAMSHRSLAVAKLVEHLTQHGELE